MYQWTDAQGTNIQNFCKYLQENMNVEFEYESTFTMMMHRYPVWRI